MKQPKNTVNNAHQASGPALEENSELGVGGLRLRTDLRAGLTWDDPSDQAQQLWSNLTSVLSNLTGGAEQS